MTVTHGSLPRLALIKLVWHNSRETMRRQTISMVLGGSPELYTGFLRLELQFTLSSITNRILLGEDCNDCEEHTRKCITEAAADHYVVKGGFLTVSNEALFQNPTLQSFPLRGKNGRSNWIIRSKATKQTQIASPSSKIGVCFIRGCKTRSTNCSLF